MKNYKILTAKSCDQVREENGDPLLLWLDQCEVIDSRCPRIYTILFTDGRESECDWESAIQMLSIKEGFDVVEYENGNIGVMAYYDGRENGFELVEVKA